MKIIGCFISLLFLANTSFLNAQEGSRGEYVEKIAGKASIIQKFHEAGGEIYLGAASAVVGIGSRVYAVFLDKAAKSIAKENKVITARAQNLAKGIGELNNTTEVYLDTYQKVAGKAKKTKFSARRLKQIAGGQPPYGESSSLAHSVYNRSKGLHRVSEVNAKQAEKLFLEAKQNAKVANSTIGKFISLIEFKKANNIEKLKLIGRSSAFRTMGDIALIIAGVSFVVYMGYEAFFEEDLEDVLDEDIQARNDAMFLLLDVDFEQELSLPVVELLLANEDLINMVFKGIYVMYQDVKQEEGYHKTL